MRTIITSDELKNDYDKITERCHQTEEPIFVSENGKVDVVVLSLESFDRLTGIDRSRERILKGIEESASGETDRYEEAMALARASIK
jgi:prevent-host-death family protein